MNGRFEDRGPRYQAVLKPLEWEQRMLVAGRQDLLRIVALMASDGIAISEEVALKAWHRFSEEEHCATWYGLGSDDEIRRNLMPHLELQPVAEP
jgi:hypothetical protein